MSNTNTALATNVRVALTAVPHPACLPARPSLHCLPACATAAPPLLPAWLGGHGGPLSPSFGPPPHGPLSPLPTLTHTAPAALVKGGVCVITCQLSRVQEGPRGGGILGGVLFNRHCHPFFLRIWDLFWVACAGVCRQRGVSDHYPPHAGDKDQICDLRATHTNTPMPATIPSTTTSALWGRPVTLWWAGLRSATVVLTAGEMCRKHKGVCCASEGCRLPTPSACLPACWLLSWVLWVQRTYRLEKRSSEPWFMKRNNIAQKPRKSWCRTDSQSPTGSHNSARRSPLHAKKRRRS